MPGLTTRVGNPLRWPLTVRAPMVFALFMVVVSAVLTNAVLSRLSETQQRHLTQVSSVYLEGLASAIRPYVLRDDVWEIFDALERSAGVGAALGVRNVIVVDPSGRVMASSSPHAHPVGGQVAGLQRFEGEQTLRIDIDAASAEALKPLRYQGRFIGQIFAQFDMSAQIAERREVLGTLLLTNAAISLVLAGVGYWLLRRMLTPLRLLSTHLNESAAGNVQPIALPARLTVDSEFGRLFTRFNAMAEAVNEREALARQLAQEERLASLGRLASGMAHEINNPLGGLFNAIDTLKQHGLRPGVRAASLHLLERALRGIRDVVRTTLATYRADRDGRELTRSDIDDLKLLIGSETARKRLAVRWDNGLGEKAALPASAVRQILLNLMLNAVQASPEGGEIGVLIRTDGQHLALTVNDRGGGLPAAALDLLEGRSNRPVGAADGVGLGLWMTRRLVDELGGAIRATIAAGATSIAVTLPLPVAQELGHAA
jgi:signal transduction histidine kinase